MISGMGEEGQLAEGMGAGGCSLCSQNVSGLMLNRKLRPLIIELVVILNHLGLIYL